MTGVELARKATIQNIYARFILFGRTRTSSYTRTGVVQVKVDKFS